VAAGTSLVSEELVKKQDFKALTARASEFAEAVQRARQAQ